MLLLMLLEGLGGLDTFFCQCDSQLASLKLASVDGFDDFLGDAMGFEDDECMAFQPSVRVPCEVYVLDCSAVGATGA
jgi:hypothetical protein